MFFQVLSHASMMVRSGKTTLLTDPWLVGSCYWRSWWNYPPVDPKLVESLQPTAVYITHVHWDHFHGASLKKFSRDTHIIVPFERSTRVKRDLNSIGFKNVTELPHGDSIVLDGMKLTSYQFSHWGDSALVVEADGIALLDANDAKFMGAPLDQILRNHPRFDFAFRSHSSANDRVCYHYTDLGRDKEEDPDLYAESFYHFMQKVKPRYAVPFASNHCHLHREVAHFNRIVETPVRVQQYVARRPFTDTELAVMVSGDSWDSQKGFVLQDHTWFSDRDAHLAHYAESQQHKLDATYAREDKARVTVKDFDRFFKQRFLPTVPRLLRRSFRNRPVIFCATHAAGADYFSLNLYTGETSAITKEDVREDSLVFETAARILREAMALNMFSAIGISKRVTYRSRREDARHLRKLNELLAAYEYEVLPLRRFFSLRTARVYARRWREIVLYIQLVAGLIAGKSIHELETEQLSGGRPLPRPSSA
jgi:UDP-MurNAc hydroxylase